MKNRYSTQQLNQNLSEVLKQVKQGEPVEITQEGEPFVVILSATEYQRLTAPKSHFWQSIQHIRFSNDLEELGIESEVFAEVRDKTPGREVNF